MNPLLGLLIASAVSAVIGTALKGIIRPLSWALLAGVALLFGSSKVVEATNSLSQNPALNSSPTAPLTTAAVSSPTAAQGWQSAASSLNPVLSSIYTPSQPGQPDPNAPGPNPSNPDSPNLNPGDIGSVPPAPAPPPDRVSSQPSPPPISGYW